MFWRSVVVKVWFTIILLVSFVLFTLTMLLLQFFENSHVKEAERNLHGTASKIAHIIEDTKDEKIGIAVLRELADDSSVIIVKGQTLYEYTPDESAQKSAVASLVKSDKTLKQVIDKRKAIQKKVYVDGNGTKGNQPLYVVGVPFAAENNQRGAVYLYQSLAQIEEPAKYTTRFIWLAAGIAIVLTTIFAFFLSTRITAPLRKMRLAAFEVAKGNFDTKVPILTYDEIGELAIAFNKMGRQLKFNIDALNQEKEQLSSILSSMADGVMTLNREGVLLITNPPAERFLQSWYYEQGKTKDNDEMRELPSKILSLFKHVVTIEREQIAEITIQGRTWAILMSPLYNQTTIRGAVAVLRDISEERKLDKLRKDFIANVSHELRTPIAMLQGYSEAIVDDIAGSEEEQKEIAQIIYEESLRMGRLVNELLDLARMEAGHVQLEKDHVHIKEFADRVVRKFQGLAKDKEITLSLEMNVEQQNEFYMDPDRIEQVLTNLIDNAIRHTKEAGSVTLCVEEYHDGLLVKVSDTGDGIPEEDLPFVFERFYKADKARTRGKSGTGLGLAIAKNIVEAHGGSINVHSKLGEGTTFSLVLPQKTALQD